MDSQSASAPVDMCAIPAARPPNGKPNFENPVTLGPEVLSIGTVLCVLSVMLVAGRIRLNWGRLMAADYFTIAACIFNIGFTGIQLSSWRMYRHQWDIPVCWFTTAYFKTLLMQECFFFPVYFTSKAAIFLLYRQLFGVKKWMRHAVDAGILVTFVLYAPNVPLAAIYSAPRVGEPWSVILFSDGPHKMVYFSIVMASVSTLLDLYIFVLPLSTIGQLHMPAARRVQLVGVFATASLGVLASVLSLVYRVELLDTSDSLWPQSIVSICALIESNVAIIVGCMPAFAQYLKLHIGGSSFLRSLRTRLLGGSRGSRGASGGGRGGGSGHSDLSGEKYRGMGKQEVQNQITTWGGGGGGGGGRPSGRHHGKNNYYEMSDATLLQSKAEAVEAEEEGAPEGGIVRSVDVVQHWQFQSDSTERLA